MTRWIMPEDTAGWAAMLEGVRSSAYRLEALQYYNEPGGDEAVARFDAGEPHDMDTSWWRSLVAGHVAAGRSFTRVRVVAEPLTDYTRLELAVYPEFAAAGEQVRILPVDARDQTGQPPDYWLIDDRDVWLMHYNADATFAGAELLDSPVDLATYRKLRDIAITKSMPLDAYLTTTA